MPTADTPVVSQWKLLKQFVAPLGGVRYVCAFQASDARDAHTRTFDADPNARKPWKGAGAAPGTAFSKPEDAYDIRTKVHTYRSRYRPEKIDLAGEYDQVSGDDSEGELVDEFGNNLQSDG